MDSIDKEKIATRYQERIRQVGHGPAAIGEPKGRQGYYFDFLLQFEGMRPDDSIIDIGCGYGDLYGYLRSKGWRGDYLGVDIVPDLIDEAKRRYPEARFKIQDIQEEKVAEPFDWCICCHALTSDTQKTPFLTHAGEMLRLMWNSCRRGLVFNMLSPLADYTNPIHARPPIGAVVDLVTSLTGRFTLRHDYMPFEYAVYAYKENQIDRSLLIFSEYRETFDSVSAAWKPAGA